MKRQFLLTRMLLLFALIVGSGSSVWATVYQKVTSTAGLEAGAKYLLVYENGVSSKALGAISTTSTTYGIGVSVTVSDSKITITNEAVDVLTLEASSEKWKFKSSLASNKYLHWSSGNSLANDATGSTWSISYSGNTLTIQHGTDDSRKIKWNASSPRFACYTSAQTDVALYKEDTTPVTSVTGVELNKTETSIVCGNTETLTETILPDNADDKSVTWSSSNEDVATVEDGVVTAKAVGIATITVTTVDMGKTASCEVTVTANSTKPALVETIFKETFDKVTKNGNTAIDLSELDNSGWTKNGDVYGNDGTYGARLAKGSGAGSITTPAIPEMKTGAIVSFKAQGWDSDETTISISGSDCSVSPTSFTDLSYSSLSAKEVTVTVTGNNPQITFSAASGVRIKIDDITISQTKTTTSVSLNDAGFASYCSPFALDLTPTSDYAAYAVKTIGDNKVKFTKIPGKVAANTPFILYNIDKANKTVKLPIIDDDDVEIAAVSDNALIGTLSPTYVSAPSGYTNFGMSGSKFVPMTAGVVRANKAYLRVDDKDITGSESRSLQVIFDEETTGISNVEITKPEAKNNVYYNLNGQRVANPSKGLYIVNGKKVIIK